MTDLISRADAINAICEDGTKLEQQGRYILLTASRKQRDADILSALPTVDAVPVTWIEGEIKWLKEMDNPFATMSAGQIEAMLKRWKDGDGNDTV